MMSKFGYISTILIVVLAFPTSSCQKTLSETPVLTPTEAPHQTTPTFETPSRQPPYAEQTATQTPIIVLPTNTPTLPAGGMKEQPAPTVTEVPRVWNVMVIGIETREANRGWLPYTVHLALENVSTEFQKIDRMEFFPPGQVQTEEGYTYEAKIITRGLFDWTIPPGFRVRGGEGPGGVESFRATFDAAETAHPTFLQLGELGTFDLRDVPQPPSFPVIDASAQLDQLPVSVTADMVRVTLSDVTVIRDGAAWTWTATYENLDSGYGHSIECGLWPRALFRDDGYVLGAYWDLQNYFEKIGPGYIDEMKLFGSALKGLTIQRSLVLVENSCEKPDKLAVFETFTWQVEKEGTSRGPSLPDFTLDFSSAFVRFTPVSPSSSLLQPGEVELARWGTSRPSTPVWVFVRATVLEPGTSLEAFFAGKQKSRQNSVLNFEQLSQGDSTLSGFSAIFSVAEGDELDFSSRFSELTRIQEFFLVNNNVGWRVGWAAPKSIADENVDNLDSIITSFRFTSSCLGLCSEFH